MPSASHWLGLVGILGFGSVWPTLAAPPDANPTDWVARLGHPSYSAREAAQVELIRLGEAGRSAVESATNHPNLEIRVRAQAVLDRLKRDAEQRPFVQAEQITFDYSARPLSEALADLATRSGRVLRLDATHPNPLRPVTAKAGPLPVWEAIETFRQAAGLVEVPLAMEVPNLNPRVPGQEPFAQPALRTVYYPPPPVVPQTAGQVGVVFAEAPVELAAALPADRRGAIRVQALPAQHPAHAVAGGGRSIDLGLDVTPAAGFDWAEGVRVRVRRCLDDTGRPVAPATPLPHPGFVADDTLEALIGNPLANLNARLVIVNGQPIVLNNESANAALQPNPRLLKVSLNLDSRPAKGLQMLEGVVCGDIRVANQTVAQVPDLARAVGTRLFALDGSILTITRFAPAPGGVSVEIAWESPPITTDMMILMMQRGYLDAPGGNLIDRLTFTDTAGRKLTAPQVRRSEMQSNGLTTSGNVELHFPVPADGSIAATLTGSRRVSVEVPFTLTDVPLP